jgi:hypothetical protein
LVCLSYNSLSVNANKGELIERLEYSSWNRKDSIRSFKIDRVDDRKHGTRTTPVSSALARSIVRSDYSEAATLPYPQEAEH